GPGLRFERPELKEAGLPAHGPGADGDLLGVRDDQVEAAATRDGDVLLAIAREGDLAARLEWLVEAWRQQVLVADAAQLAQALDDRLAWREDERVLHERILGVGILDGHRELGRHDRADQDRFPRPHGERQDVARVVER